MIEWKELLNTLYLNFATISQLELLFNRKSQSVKGSIFDTINRTVTLGGKQMLRSWLLSPSSEEVTINGRLDVVDEFISNQEMRSAVRKLLHLYGNVDGVLSTLVKIQSESSVRSSVRLVKSYLQLQRNCELMPQFYQVLSKCTSELTRVIASICHQKEWDDLHSLLGQFFDSDFNVSMNGLSKHQLCLCLKTGIDASLDVNRSVYFQAIEDTIALIKTYQQQCGSILLF